MGTAEAKQGYKIWAATAECVNALARNRGLQRLRVRGLRKARAALLWFAIAHNLMRSLSLRAASQAALAED
jgi:IS5 family transposase